MSVAEPIELDDPDYFTRVRENMVVNCEDWPEKFRRIYDKICVMEDSINVMNHECLKKFRQYMVDIFYSNDWNKIFNGTVHFGRTLYNFSSVLTHEEIRFIIYHLSHKLNTLPDGNFYYSYWNIIYIVREYNELIMHARSQLEDRMEI